MAHVIFIILKLEYCENWKDRQQYNWIYFDLPLVVFLCSQNKGFISAFDLAVDYLWAFTSIFLWSMVWGNKNNRKALNLYLNKNYSNWTRYIVKIHWAFSNLTSTVQLYLFERNKFNIAFKKWFTICWTYCQR